MHQTKLKGYYVPEGDYMKLVAEFGKYFIIEDKSGINRLFERGSRKALYQSADYWRVENKLVSLAW